MNLRRNLGLLTIPMAVVLIPFILTVDISGGALVACHAVIQLLTLGAGAGVSLQLGI